MITKKQPPPRAGVQEKSDETVVKPARGILPSARATRETVESIVIAFVLAFLFKTFEAEAFVIPTGSMAPTLQGLHKDVNCPECGYNYRVGVEKSNVSGAEVQVQAGRCPICRFDYEKIGNERSYDGDRILVNKFAYELGDPQRWDVIVFRFPGDAKVNYIKRLVGLPNETIEIRGGDIYVGPYQADAATPNPSKPPFVIARKPPHKLRAMLQDVDDNHYISKRLDDGGFPRRWNPSSEHDGRWREAITEHPVTTDFSDPATRLAQSFTFDAAAETDPVKRADWSWLEYGHVVADWSERRFERKDLLRHPRPENSWKYVEKGIPIHPVTNPVFSVTITDDYAYNNKPGSGGENDNWVGDLAVECEVDVAQPNGELALVLVEGGYQFTATLDLEKKQAKLSIADPSGRRVGFAGDGPATDPVGDLPVSTGKHKVLFANADDRLYLWLDDRVVSFDRPTIYNELKNKYPPGEDDLGRPIRIGARGARLALEHLRVMRDVYYIASRLPNQHLQENNPVERFSIGPDQFFTLGDNSPKSNDGRMWNDAEHPGTPDTVERRLLLGKAVFIYWPHARHDIFWYCPNFGRMRFVR